MIEFEILKNSYNDYLKTTKKRYIFSDEILYEMCKNYPDHKKQEIIIGKLNLIGRTYAAAIERRKISDNYQGDKFYDKKVGPEMEKIGKELDLRLEKLRKSKGSIKNKINEILGLHKFLMDVFYRITHLEKRSLASKYLHFHCPEKFFIYDSRARSAINKLVKKKDIKDYSSINDYDPEYTDFVCRMTVLQEKLKESFGSEATTPRKLDGFLLKFNL